MATSDPPSEKMGPSKVPPYADMPPYSPPGGYMVPPYSPYGYYPPMPPPGYAPPHSLAVSPGAPGSRPPLDPHMAFGPPPMYPPPHRIAGMPPSADATGEKPAPSTPTREGEANKQDSPDDRDASGVPPDPAIYRYVKPKPPSNPEMLNRREKKNAQSRARAALHRKQIREIEAKPQDERTEEEIEFMNKFQGRRERKNHRSKERALQKKSEYERIINKPPNKRTSIEEEFLRTFTMAKSRKNAGDRMRRQLQKAKKSRPGAPMSYPATASPYPPMHFPPMPYPMAHYPYPEHAPVPPGAPAESTPDAKIDATKDEKEATTELKGAADEVKDENNEVKDENNEVKHSLKDSAMHSADDVKEESVASKVTPPEEKDVVTEAV